jgi:small subunit ribosomal protein S13
MGGSGKRVKDVDKPKEAEAKEEKKEKPKRIEKPVQQYSLVRVSGTDLNGDKPIARAILGIKGISWSMSNAICVAGEIDAKKKLKDFSETEIAKIEQIIKDPIKFGIPVFLVNRNRDMGTGKDIHLTGADLDVARKFDIQRYVDLKTYRGWRHMLGQPVRGQRTRSKFRQKGRVVGVLRKEIKIATGATAAPATGGAPAAAPAKKEEKK